MMGSVTALACLLHKRITVRAAEATAAPAGEILLGGFSAPASPRSPPGASSCASMCCWPHKSSTGFLSGWKFKLGADQRSEMNHTRGWRRRDGDIEQC